MTMQPFVNSDLLLPVTRKHFSIFLEITSKENHEDKCPQYHMHSIDFTMYTFSTTS